MNSPEKICPWTGDDPFYIKYHDKEWGLPKTSDQELFEKLVLEGFQAGLSWITILRKRENFRKAFDHFNAERIVGYKPRKIKALLSDPGIIRNRLKIEASVHNARAYLDLQGKSGFAAFLWDYVDGRPLTNKFRSMEEIPTETELSRALSKELKRLGFKFCGPTIVYAFMQSVGMVNDHLVSCHRHQACLDFSKTFKAPTSRSLNDIEI